jgi:hypothetical protein
MTAIELTAAFLVSAPILVLAIRALAFVGVTLARLCFALSDALFWRRVASGDIPRPWRLLPKDVKIIYENFPHS